MAIKITGAVLIIITSCIIGYLLSIKEDLRCRDLSEIEKSIEIRDGDWGMHVSIRSRCFQSGRYDFKNL